jgi:succinyl-diaminopimelate desuccinylase
MKRILGGLGPSHVFFRCTCLEPTGGIAMPTDSWEQRVIQHVDTARDELVELCRDLVRIPSWDREQHGEADAARRVGATLKNHGIPAEFLQSHPSIENLVAVLEGAPGKPRLLFNGHVDVVPPGSLDDWTVNPFGAEVKDERIYGRGSLDMKGGVAAMTTALCVLRDLKVPLAGTAVLNVVGDEERQGELGTGWCIKHIWKKIRADACIVGEPTGGGVLGHTVGIGEKGPVWLNVTTRGRKAHGSIPLMGENAINRMMALLSELVRRGPPTVPPPIKREALIGQIAQAMGVEPSVLAPLMQGGGTPNLLYAAVEALTRTTLNVGTISGGVAANVVPDRCDAQLDFRILPGQSPQDMVDAVTALAKELGPSDTVQVEVRNAFQGTQVPNFEKDRLVTTLLETSKQLLGSTICFMFPAATDGRLLRAAGIPSTVAYGPGNTATAHAADECIAIEDLVKATKVFAVTAMRFLGLRRS